MSLQYKQMLFTMQMEYGMPILSESVFMCGLPFFLTRKRKEYV